MQLCAQKAWLAISAFSPSDPVRALAVSLFDPSGHRWAMLASPGAGQDGPLLVAKLAQCLQGQKEVLKIRLPTPARECVPRFWFLVRQQLPLPSASDTGLDLQSPWSQGST